MARSRIGVITIMVVLAMITGVGVAYLFSPPQNLDAQSMPPGLAATATAQQLVPLESTQAEQLAPTPTSSDMQLEQATIVVPPTVLTQPSNAAAPPSPVEPTPAPSAPRVVEYTVQRGDILAGIASEFGVSVPQILAVNSIENPDSLRVGQVLQIPQP